MSDNVNAQIASGGTPVNPVAGYLNWQQLAQGQAATALTQQQAQAALIANQQAAMQLELRKRMLAPFLQPGTAPVGQGAAAPQSGGGFLGGGGMQSGNGTAPVAPVTAAPLDGASTPSAAVAAGASPAAASSSAYPGGMSAATHSPGMPQNGAPVGGQVSPYGAVQTMYGVPLPYGQAMAVMSANDPSSAIKGAMEERRQRLVELLSQPDWQQGVTQAYQEGWIDPQHYQMMVQNPGMRNQALLGLSDANTYNGILEKYSGQGLQLNPQTGQPQISPAAIAAKGAASQSEAYGKSAGELPLAGPLAAAGAMGRASAETAPGPTVPVTLPNGSTGYVGTIANKAVLAAQAARGGVPAAGGPLAGLGGAPGSGGLAPEGGTAANPLVGPLGAPAAPAAGAGPLGGLAPATPPAAAAAAASAAPAGGVQGMPALASGPPKLGPPGELAQDVTKKFIDQDQTAVSDAMSRASAAQQAQTQLLNVRALIPQINAGSMANARQSVQSYLATFAPDAAQNFVKAVSAGQIDPSKAGATQEFVKLTLQNAGAAERETLGSRGGYGAIQLYQKSFPNLESQPSAVKDMSNLLLIAHQRDIDYANGANTYFQANADNVLKGGQYSNLKKYDQQFLANNPPQVYVGAAAALNGHPYSDWSKGLSPAQQKAALGIVARADSTAQVIGPDGRTYAVPAPQ